MSTKQPTAEQWQSGDKRFTVEVGSLNEPVSVNVDDATVVFEKVEFTPGAVIVTTKSGKHRLPTVRQSGWILTSLDGYQFAFKLADKRAAADSATGVTGTAEFVAELTSPMPGKILKMAVEVGQKVEVDDALVVVEAMKMEHTLRAACPAIVSAVHVKADATVAPGDLLISLEAIEND